MFRLTLKLFMSLIAIVMYTDLLAQCTLSFEDYNKNLAIGTTYVGYISAASTSTMVYIGEASPNPQYWDFSTLTYELSGTSQSIDPLSAPFHSSYLQANVVIKEQTELDGVSYITYNYEQLTNNAIYMHAVSDETEILLEYTPPSKSMILPCTYGTEWELEPDSTEIIPGIYSITKSHYKVDGYGTIKLPFGEFDAIRVMLNLTTITQTGIINDSSTSQAIYFISPEFVQVNLFLSPDQIGETTIIGNGIGYTAPSSVLSSVQEKEAQVPTKFELYQNYPNPFNPSTKIKFSIPKSSNVKLTIYNSIGEQVEVLVNEFIQAGVYEYLLNGNNYSSGNYFYEIKTNNFTKVRKMTFVK